MGKITGRMALAVITFCVLYSFIGTATATGKTGKITVYWGQNTNEGSLRQTCETRLYSTVIISFLTDFGSGNYKLNLAGHSLSEVGPDVDYCQSRKIQVLLAIGGSKGTYSLASQGDAKPVAEYLWRMYLGGRPMPRQKRPFDSAVLDGIDFDIEKGSSQYYDDLARYLKAYSSGNKKVWITAAPQCPYPDRWLEGALKIGILDRVHVQFYNNPACSYGAGNEKAFTRAWNTWTKSLPAGSSIYLGLPASPRAARSGYVPPAMLTSTVLPIVQNSAKYGGIMLWNRYWDLQNGYAKDVKRDV
ncbi:hypothetical protein PR202_gb26116 [Eleusine coracana subsp. coracana]|uniref:chitinase n=1 Tax=Eleusine coracana subsp. coracana TaxID=191504 RepID=A0AAV5FQQ6_ELECO|nr:hypothetical protein QOZ80_4BG0357980 [Eleusine coracana subsp. coracana]GJN37188.1 hypothetical protein PR202_gb26116 [Eleusine coracana subsp. coracana]